MTDKIEIDSKLLERVGDLINARIFDSQSDAVNALLLRGLDSLRDIPVAKTVNSDYDADRLTLGLDRACQVDSIFNMLTEQAAKRPAHENFDVGDLLAELDRGIQALVTRSMRCQLGRRFANYVREHNHILYYRGTNPRLYSRKIPK